MEKRAPSNKGTLETLTGLEQTEVLFEQFQVLKKSPPTTSEEYKTATKYFRNIRQRQECALPTMTECENSGVGLAFGLVWDTTDPETQWSPATSAARTTTDPMVATSFEYSSNKRPGSEISPCFKFNSQKAKAVRASCDHVFVQHFYSLRSPNSIRYHECYEQQGAAEYETTKSFAQGFQAIKRIVNQRESNPPRHLEKEGFNSSEPLRASLRRNDVSIKLLQNRSRVYNIN